MDRLDGTAGYDWNTRHGRGRGLGGAGGCAAAMHEAERSGDLQVASCLPEPTGHAGPRYPSLLSICRGARDSVLRGLADESRRWSWAGFNRHIGFGGNGTGGILSRPELLSLSCESKGGPTGDTGLRRGAIRPMPRRDKHRPAVLGCGSTSALPLFLLRDWRVENERGEMDGDHRWRREVKGNGIGRRGIRRSVGNSGGHSTGAAMWLFVSAIVGGLNV